MMGRQFRSAAVFAALLVLIVGLVTACGSSGGGSSSTSTTATTAGLKAAPDFSGTTLAGEAVSLSEYRGKPLVLAFMASW